MIEAQKKKCPVPTPLPHWYWSAMPESERSKFSPEFVAEQDALLTQQPQVPPPPADPAAAARARIAEIDALLSGAKNSPVKAAPPATSLPPLVTWDRCIACGQPAEKNAGSEDTPRCSRCRRGGI
jgi:hypothetical protein